MKKLAVFLLAILVITSVAQAAASYFSANQVVRVEGENATKTYIMDLTHFNNIAVTGMILGGGAFNVSYTLYWNIWTGMYIYDYAYGRFEDVIWAWSQNL